MMPVPIAHPQWSVAVAQMLTAAHGPHAQIRRTTRVQVETAPFAGRFRGSGCSRYRHLRGTRRPQPPGPAPRPQRSGLEAAPRRRTPTGLAVHPSGLQNLLNLLNPLNHLNLLNHLNPRS